MEWILASASPRRRELMGELVEKFDVLVAQGDEAVEGMPTPKELVMILAKRKAGEVALKAEARGKAVVGSDTVVALDGKILGKPKDEDEAFEMLSALSGRTHEVYTGVSILYPQTNGERGELTEAECTKVQFERLTTEQILAYIATGSPMDKAGAYGIQDGGLVKEIIGSYTNVVGFPLELCRAMMEKIREKERGE